MLYVLAELELSYAGLPTFMAAAPILREAAEAQGWVLENALVTATGRVNTVIHLWQIRDSAHYFEVIEQLAAHPRIGEIYAALCAAVVNETIRFLSPAAYAPAGAAQ